MRIFLTGATGFVGSAVISELLQAGHQVTGLVRSEDSARRLAASGVQVHRGDMEDLESLRAGASNADAVIHTAFRHDFNNFGPAAELDRQAIGALASSLAGSHRPLIVTSSTSFVVRQGPLAIENDSQAPDFPRRSESAALEAAAQGVAASIIRLPPTVHGPGDHAFVPALIALARQKGVSAYIAGGHNRWPAVHRLDAARLYRLAIEKGASAVHYHAVADEGIPFREIAESIARGLAVPTLSLPPEKAQEHFGWLAHFVSLDGPASSAQTRASLGWQPSEPGLLADLDLPHYFAS